MALSAPANVGVRRHRRPHTISPSFVALTRSRVGSLFAADFFAPRCGIILLPSIPRGILNIQRKRKGCVRRGVSCIYTSSSYYYRYMKQRSPLSLLPIKLRIPKKSEDCGQTWLDRGQIWPEGDLSIYTKGRFSHLTVTKWPKKES